MSANYTTREAVKLAVDVRDSARANAQIDRLITDASRFVDRLCHRVFYPRIATFTVDWPRNDGTSYRVWLKGTQELIELHAVTSGGVTIDPGDVFLYPDDGPPYDRIEISQASAASFESGPTDQRSLSLTGLLASASIAERSAGTLAEALDSAETAIDVADARTTRVGSVLRVDDERMIVTEKSALDTGIDLAGSGITAEMKSTALTLSTSVGAPQPGEMIVIDAERMLVTETIGTTMIVTRACDGTVLATHSSGAGIYAYRTLTVQRGALGTTAAAHSNGAAILVWTPEGPIEGLTIAKTLDLLAQENSGYARVIGVGEGQREARGAGLAARIREVYDGYARKGRTGAV